MLPRQTKRTETGCGDVASPIAFAVYESCIRVFGVYAYVCCTRKKKLPMPVEKKSEDLGMIAKMTYSRPSEGGLKTR